MKKEIFLSCFLVIIFRKLCANNAKLNGSNIRKDKMSKFGVQGPVL
jgi:hypothetical protein